MVQGRRKRVTTAPMRKAPAGEETRSRRRFRVPFHPFGMAVDGEGGVQEKASLM